MESERISLHYRNEKLRLQFIACTEYDRDRTVDEDETKHLLVQCELYYMRVTRRQKHFKLNILPRIYFHIVMPIVVDHTLELCFASTTMTVLVSITS